MPMIKLKVQLDVVASAIPLLRPRRGKISAGNNHGIGPHVKPYTMLYSMMNAHIPAAGASREENSAVNAEQYDVEGRYPNASAPGS